MQPRVLVCIALMALLRASAATTEGLADNMVLRRLQQAVRPPSFCVSYGDCKPVAVKPICPKGTVQDITDPSSCWYPCPLGYTVYKTKYCRPRCPKTETQPQYQVTAVDDKAVTCTRCKSKNCEYVSVPATDGTKDKSGCYMKCGVQPYQALPIAVPSNPPKCCMRGCPPNHPIYISDTVCANAKGGRILVQLGCKERMMCDEKPEQIQVPVLPRNMTGKVCPPKPPAVLTVSGPNGLSCFRCTCGLPSQNPDGSISCSGVTNPCPAGYKKCGPYCWDASDPALTAILGNTDEAACYKFLLYFKNCLRVCPRKIVNPTDPTGGTVRGNVTVDANTGR